MITTSDILEEVSNVFDCPVSQIISKRRGYKEADARHAAVYLLKTQTFATNKEIASRLGYKHTTKVCNAKTYAESKMSSDPGFRQKITIVVTELVKLKLNEAKQPNITP